MVATARLRNGILSENLPVIESSEGDGMDHADPRICIAPCQRNERLPACRTVSKAVESGSAARIRQGFVRLQVLMRPEETECAWP
jgi:hypothetical protein